MEDERHPVERILKPIPGMAHAVVRNEVQLNQLNDPDCPICYTEFAVGTVVTRTACGHNYHYSCIIPLLNVSKQAVTKARTVHYAELSAWTSC